jgi:hypothetical protein
MLGLPLAPGAVADLVVFADLVQQQDARANEAMAIKEKV